ncbi:MAG: hypothetical protein ACKV2U_19525 [Bryobacteraceae bacterium]
MLAKASRDRFNKTAAAYLREHYSGHLVTKSDSALAAFVDQGVDHATTFDITREVDVIRFLEVLLAIGANFESSAQYSWVADYLREGMRPEARLEIVMKRLHFGSVKIHEPSGHQAG